MNPEEDTEWNDALRRVGVLPPKESDQTVTIDDALEQAQKLAYERRLEDKSLEELEELEDEEDEAFMSSYRQKRFEEMHRLARGRYGTVEPLSKSDFVQQVSEASAQEWVFLHLFADANPECKVLAERLSQFAQRHPHIKCLKIPGTHCIENYPEQNMPTLLIYGPDQFRDQIVGLLRLGGMKGSVGDLERIALEVGAITKDHIMAANDLYGRENNGDESE